MTCDERFDKWAENHPAYVTWRGIMKRCGLRGNVSAKESILYRDKGISVCEEWRKLVNFESWLFRQGWKRRCGLEVVRLNKDGDFCPENCMVMTHAQAQNFRSNVFRVCGVSVRDLIGSKEVGTSNRHKNVSQRLRRYGWKVGDAISEPTVPRDMLTKVGFKVK